ncbi:hypothetical protein CH330_08560 [candidate division WOR-3 bacterium JGI_Cruoil_03_51_56]|uniref:Glycosyltransferase RgtA/B/C/D-like domain-containing protein n=1 Tax=candidate division WOR-3 bacterium JGI_Cruoil_03_51_56 TaxID=1973747 RepID=A0A235BQJ1_UNCW3|nr:MAG: hypothetical protein CH330_08560 [candidate division WOR-3 bacterium JGI_Cruoil_03_51_56]
MKVHKAFFLILVGGFIVRLAYVFQVAHKDPMFYFPVMDAEFHYHWTLAIIRGGWLARMPFFKAPLYPYFLAGVFRVFGTGLFVPRLFQAIIGAGSCGLVYLLGRELFNRRVALAGGVAAIFYPLLIYFDGELLMPCLLVFLVLFGILLLYKCRKWDRYWFVPGAVFGLAAITRPNVLVFGALAIIWFWVEFGRGLWKRFIPFAFALIAIVLPVTIRNYVVSHEFIPVAWQGGINFYIGNNPQSDGITAVVPKTRKDWWGGYYDARRLAEEASGRKLGYSEMDRYWLGQGLEFWKQSPGEAIKLLFRKCYLFLAGYEIANNRDIYFFSHFTFLKFLIFAVPFLQFPFGLLLPLAIVGVVLLRKSWRRFLPVYLFISGYSLSFIIFFVTARYRMPLIPFLLLFASSGGIGLFKAIRAHRGQAIPLVVLVGSILFLNANLAHVPGVNKAQVYSVLAGHEAKLGRLKDASEFLKKAWQADSTWPDQYFVSGLIARQQDDGAKAEHAFRTALFYDSSRADFWVYLGDLKAGQKQLDSARSFYEKALDLDPYSAFAHCHLGNLYYEQGELTQALHSYITASELIPDYLVAIYNVGLVYFRMGDTARTRAAWEQVVRIDPSNTLSRRVSHWLQNR